MGKMVVELSALLSFKQGSLLQYNAPLCVILRERQRKRHTPVISWHCVEAVVFETLGRWAVARALYRPYARSPLFRPPFCGGS